VPLSPALNLHRHLRTINFHATCAKDQTRTAMATGEPQLFLIRFELIINFSLSRFCVGNWTVVKVWAEFGAMLPSEKVDVSLRVRNVMRDAER
jgi:hypothetical protein